MITIKLTQEEVLEAVDLYKGEFINEYGVFIFEDFAFEYKCFCGKNNTLKPTRIETKDKEVTVTYYANPFIKEWLKFTITEDGNWQDLIDTSLFMTCAAKGIKGKEMQKTIEDHINQYTAIRFALMYYIMKRIENREIKICEAKEYKKSNKKTVNKTDKEQKDIILLDDLVRYINHSNGHKIIKCEAWGVRGHFRHYKSGKVIFIKPYKKGKKRNEVKELDRNYILEG